MGNVLIETLEKNGIHAGSRDASKAQELYLRNVRSVGPETAAHMAVTTIEREREGKRRFGSPLVEKYHHQ